MSQIYNHTSMWALETNKYGALGGNLLEEFGGHITVRDVLKIDPFDKATLIVGEEGLERTVTGVTVIDSPDGVHWVHGGEIVITTGYCFKHDAAVQKWVIDNMVKNGAAALGLKLGRHLWELPEPIREVATSNRLPVLSLPYEPAWSDFIMPVTRHILYRQVSDIGYLESLARAFRGYLVDVGGIPKLAEITSGLIGCPITIGVECEGTYHKWHYPPDEVPPYAREKWHRPPGTNTNSIMRKLVSGESAIRLPATNEHPSLVAAPITFSGKQMGSVIAWEAEKSLRRMDFLGLEYASGILGFELTQQQTLRELKRDMVNELLDALIHGKFSSRLTAELWVRRLDIRLAEDYRVMVVLPDGVDTDNPDREKTESLLETAEACIKPLDDCLVGLDRDSRIVLFVPESSATRIESLAESIAGRARGLGFDTRIGIGRFHPGLEGVKLAYSEALHSLQVCVSLARAYLRYDDLGIYRLATDDAPGRNVLLDFMSDSLQPLWESTQEKRLNLLDTLEHFVSTGGHIRKTSRELFVHPNTVRYRLRVVKQLTGLDPYDPDSLLHLHLALKLMRLRGLKPGGTSR